MYLAYVRREAVRNVTASRDAMVAGIWGNPNFDSQENKNLRSDLLRDVDEQLETAIQRIYGNDPETVDLSENPFFSAIRVPELPSQFSEQDLKEVETKAELAALASELDQT